MQSTVDDAGSAGRTRIQSASRAIQILLLIAESKTGLLAREVAMALNLTLPTTYHLLNTLVGEGVVERDERRRFMLGLRATVIADAMKDSAAVPESYLNALNAVARETGETAYLSTERRGEIVILATVEGSHAVRVAGLTTGYSAHMHARASGKLFLAFAPDDKRSALMESLDLHALTEWTITTRTALENELQTIRASGISFDRQEFQEGVTCVSMPVWNDDRVVACLTVSAPAGRFETHESEIIARLTEALQRIPSQRLALG